MKYEGKDSAARQFRLGDYLKWYEYPYYWVVNAWDRFRYTFPFVRHDLTPPGTDAKYLIRWTLWRGLYGKALYLHHIVASDWAREPHDHPKTFTSIGLWGSYTEEVYQVKGLGYLTGSLIGTGRVLVRMAGLCRRWHAPWVRQFPPGHIHRVLVAPGQTCWTLVHVGEKQQDWGFYRQDGTKTLYLDYMEEHFG